MLSWNPPHHLDGCYCLTPEEMRAWEKAEIDEIPCRSRELMEIAGREVAQLAMAHYPDVAQVLVFCGKGNNGGDGLTAAWYLSRCGLKVHIFMFAKPDDISPDAKYMFDRVQRLPRTMLSEPSDASFILEWANHSNLLVIDAIYGIGYRPTHSALMTRVYQCIAAIQCPVIAVDMPSGIDALTGYRGSFQDEAPPRALSATETITFGAPKIGQFIGDGPAHCGKLFCVDIGLRPCPFTKTRTLILGDSYWEKHLAPAMEREPGVHKGNCGHVVIIGAHPDMPGAACLSARAALRAGCGLVTIASLSPLRAPDEIMTRTICDENGAFCPDKLLPLFERADCLLVGPGLGRNDVTKEILSFCQQYTGRLILDADALWALSEETYQFNASECFITPHPAEAARLRKTSVRDILYHPLSHAQQLCADYRAVTILKSHATVIYAQTQNGSAVPFSAILPYPNPAIATAGSGDTLAGILAATLTQARNGGFARWLKSYEVAAFAVCMHSRAGRKAAQLRNYATTASDIIDQL